MIASLHLQTTNLEHVKTLLKVNLQANSSAYLCSIDGWTHVYFDQFLDDGDEDDFESVARELSYFALTIACFGEKIPAQIQCYQGFLKVPSGDLKLEQPDLSFEDLQELAYAGKLKGYEKLEVEAKKPGLAEFFGRSQDE
jgi:hypothetical protein